MSVHVLPVTPQRQIEVREALTSTDTALAEMLRQAVVSHRAGGLRLVGSIAYNHHLEVAASYLHCVEILLGKPGVAVELLRHVKAGAHDLLVLSKVARNFDSDPDRVA